MLRAVKKWSDPEELVTWLTVTRDKGGSNKDERGGVDAVI